MQTNVKNTIPHWQQPQVRTGLASAEGPAVWHRQISGQNGLYAGNLGNIPLAGCLPAWPRLAPGPKNASPGHVLGPPAGHVSSPSRGLAAPSRGCMRLACDWGHAAALIWEQLGPEANQGPRPGVCFSQWGVSGTPAGRLGGVGSRPRHRVPIEMGHMPQFSKLPKHWLQLAIPEHHPFLAWRMSLTTIIPRPPNDGWT